MQNRAISAAYWRTGHAVIKNVLSPIQCKAVSEHLDWLILNNPEVKPTLLEHWMMRNDPFWISLVRSQKLVQIASSILGSQNIACFASHYVCKLPGSDAIHWHQDGSYWPLSPMNVVSLWLAVDRADQENGCLRVIPYSHETDLSVTGLKADNFASDVQGATDRIEYDDSKAVDVILEQGDVSIHHPNTVHGSYANFSKRRRGGLTLRYISTDVKVQVGDLSAYDWEEIQMGSLYHVSGEVLNEVNPYRSPPIFDHEKHFWPSVGWNASKMQEKFLR